MKKNLIHSLIILVLSIGGAILLPNFLKSNLTIEWLGIGNFLTWTLVIFVVLSIMFHVNKPIDKSTMLPDGYHELFNEKHKVTKKGIFSNGRQVSGTRHVYKKDGTLSHIENCVNGIYTTGT